jgi:hypothetical protein
MTDTMTSQNVDLSSWDTLYIREVNADMEELMQPTFWWKNFKGRNYLVILGLNYRIILKRIVRI